MAARLKVQDPGAEQQEVHNPSICHLPGRAKWIRAGLGEEKFFQNMHLINMSTPIYNTTSAPLSYGHKSPVHFELYLFPAQ